MLIPGQVKVNVHLQYAVTVITDGREAHLVGLLLLNVVQIMRRFAQINITVEPCFDQFSDLVLSFTHHVRNTLGPLD